MISMDIIKAFAALFEGNQRSHGEFNPLRDPVNKTIQTPPELAHFADHLKGVIGIGIAPIRDDDRCVWAAIDIDAHHGKPPIDIAGLAERVEKLNLPLLVCRSKSGGAHVYLFLTHAAQCDKVRRLMASWAAALGHPGVEIFPKQDALAPDQETGQKSLGSWINLPYYGGNNTDRYCWSNGQKMPLEAFIELAQGYATTYQKLIEVQVGDHPDAPPCVQAMLQNGVGKGLRNDAMFVLTLYAKQHSPDAFRPMLLEWNRTIFEEPLPNPEVNRTISSASRREYKYRCSSRPCSDFCDSAVCITRKFGISAGEKSALDTYKLPEFGDLYKHLTNPVQWVLEIDGHMIRLDTRNMMDFNSVRIGAADKLTRIIPPMKNQDWQVMLDVKMKSAIIVEEPPESRTHGVLRQRLSEFLRRADLKVNPRDKENLKHLLRGTPVLTQVDDVQVMAFRGTDLQEYLRRNRSDELAGVSLWFTLKEIGASNKNMSVDRRSIGVWTVPFDSDLAIDFPSPVQKPEF